MLLKGIKVTILMLDPEECETIKKIQNATLEDDVAGVIRRSHKKLCALISELPTEKRKNLVIKKHKMNISDSLVIIDSGNEDNAWIQRENIGYRVSSNRRSSIYNYKKYDSELFNTNYMIYSTALDDMNSSPYPCENP